MKTKQQLCDELAYIVRVELNQQALDAIDGHQAVQPYEYEIVDRIINHLTPVMDEVVKALEEIRNHGTFDDKTTNGYGRAKNFYAIKAEKALTKLSCWRSA